MASPFAPGVLSGAADRLLAGPDPSWTDPAAWGRANFRGWSPAWYQEDIMRKLASKRKVSVIGPHGIGKTATDAAIVYWFALTREAAGVDWKVITTAGAWRQLQRYLWPEIQKWSRRLRRPLRSDELLTQEIKLHYGQAFPVASDVPENIEGAHADEILYIIDEAKNVPPATWDAIEGAMSAGNAYCLANSTPGKAEGRLYEIHQKHKGLEDWETIHVKLPDAIEAGRINSDWAENRARQWGRTSPVYINRVLGEFSTTDSDGVIPLEWLEAANERWKELAEAKQLISVPLTAVAADVASELGIDKSVIIQRYGHVTLAPETYPDVDTMEIARRVKAILDSHPTTNRRKRALAVVDAIGVGTGAVDRLREQGASVDAFMGSSKPRHTDKTGEISFLNRRAEAWWGLRDLLNPAFSQCTCKAKGKACTHNIAIPEDPELMGDLLSPKWDQTSTGLIKIEDKDETIKRLGRSPDEGDALVMAYNARTDRSFNPVEAIPVSVGKTSRWSGGNG